VLGRGARIHPSSTRLWHAEATETKDEEEVVGDRGGGCDSTRLDDGFFVVVPETALSPTSAAVAIGLATPSPLHATSSLPFPSAPSKILPAGVVTALLSTVHGVGKISSTGDLSVTGVGGALVVVTETMLVVIKSSVIAGGV
jgi:hypothetical protein